MRTFNEVKTLRREKPLKPPEQGLLWRAALRGRALHKAQGSCAVGAGHGWDPEYVPGGLVPPELPSQGSFFPES